MLFNAQSSVINTYYNIHVINARVHFLIVIIFQKQSEIMEKLNCPNSNKLLKPFFKPVKPIQDEMNLRTTTSSTESGNKLLFNLIQTNIFIATLDLLR